MNYGIDAPALAPAGAKPLRSPVASRQSPRPLGPAAIIASKWDASPGRAGAGPADFSAGAGSKLSAFRIRASATHISPPRGTAGGGCPRYDPLSRQYLERLGAEGARG